ncbi:MAG: CHAP domain-containing protein [Deltaproteobacteria bacterium]|nr:CHAP domain-containing protein [Deltaproteobacteria bacterium]
MTPTTNHTFHRASWVLSCLTIAAMAGAFAGCTGQLGEGLVENEEPTITPEIVNPSGEGFGMYTAMPACGTRLVTFEGVSAYSNGPGTGTGYSCGGKASTGSRYQCAELVMRYFKTKYGLRWWGNAKDLLRNAPRTSTRVYYNGDTSHAPVPGDMIVWTAGKYGHVALVVAVHSRTIDIIEQNIKGNGRYTLSYEHHVFGSRWGNWQPAGWVHAKANHHASGSTSGSTSTPPPSAPSTSSSSCHHGSIYGWTYCSAACPCDVGQGDCDKDSECKTGLVCAQDKGANYGAVSTVDVCQKPTTTSSTQLIKYYARDWPCESSSHAGYQYWTCQKGSIYRCEKNVGVKYICPKGCNANSVSTNDTCK